MEPNLLGTSSTTKSSFWDSKDGKWGKVIAVVLGAAALFGLYLLLPFLITLAQNMLTLALLGVSLFVLIYMILDKDVQTFVFYLYKSFIRATRTALINTDPVGIIKNYVSHLQKQFERLEEKIQELSGARKKLEDAIERAKEELGQQMGLATSAKKKGLSSAEIAVYTNQGGRLQEAIKRYSTMLNKLTGLNKLLNEMRKACKVIILDKTNQVKQIETERETMNVGFSAFKSAMSILKGDPDKKYWYDEAIENIQNDISVKSGIIEQYLVETSELMGTIDLQNSAFEEKGALLLEKWEKEGMPSLITDGSEKMPSTVPASVNYEVVSVPTDKLSGNKYKDMLKK